MIALDKNGLSYLWGKLKSRFESIESRTASNVPTSKPDTSVQDILDAQATLLDDLAVKVNQFTLLQNAWIINEESGFFEQSIGDSIFKATGSIYRVAIIPEDIFIAAGVGGIIMSGVVEGSAIFQCRLQPEVDVAVHIEHTVRREDA